ncbi:MAG: anti-sigma factor [Planctomycetota bacterium]
MSGAPIEPHDEDTLALLSDHLDGRLDAAAEAALRTRLAGDPALAAELDAMRALGAALREETARLPGAPEGFLGGVRDAIARGDGRTGDGRPKLLRFLGAAYAAAALLIVGWTIGWYVDRERGAAPASRAQTAEEPAAGVWDKTLAQSPAPSAPEPLPSADGRFFGAPAGAVDPGQRTPSDVAAEAVATARTRRAGEGDATVRRLVVRARDVVAFRAWLSLVLADQPTPAADEAGVVDAVVTTDAGTLPAAGRTTLRFALDRTTWKRLFDRLGLAAVAAEAPDGETSLEVDVVETGK